ncbi:MULTISPECIES: hypothetical protein [Providencia]|uniref:hypothetical protein n=1 Tax=Providencia TaxID=586 RepID=UPI00141A38FD|nr:MULTISPECIES: hypothetical protein [Providencia]ELR5145372.1 hypothetical protein [Providencia rettgeri]NIA43259.1 hypothetical protein [Providencia rettgeri]NIA96248.1 hypothetical protein [Providencia rettgeri]NIB14071.1 hypothetical protein [Providencia rettgeri]NIB33920.1 hypothetical protein [Providencia rettgeri]
MINSEVTPKYSSIRMSVPADLKDEFLLECKQAGVDAGNVICLSRNTPSIVNVLYETVAKLEMAKKFIGILKMFGQKRNVRIEVYADKKIVDLSGYSEEEAIRLIEASDSIRVAKRDETEDK